LLDWKQMEVASGSRAVLRSQVPEARSFVAGALVQSDFGPAMPDRPQRDRLLMIVPVMPSDRGTGLAMRAGFFLDAYSGRFDVDLVVAPFPGLGKLSAFAHSRASQIELLDVHWPDTHYRLVASLINRGDRLSAFRRCGQPSRTAFFRPLAGSLDRLSKEVDYKVVHVSRLYLAELVAPWLTGDRRGTRIVIDCDEDEAWAFRRDAVQHRRHGDLFAADWADAEAEACDRFSSRWLLKFDLVFAASDKEVKSLSAFGIRGTAVPNTAPSLPVPSPRHRRRGRPFTIAFVGTMGYAPNVDAVTWFVSRMWRRIQRVLGHRVRLLIVGSDPAAPVIRLGRQRGIQVTGPVAATAPYYRKADMVIAPIRTGGGTRIKIIEAAAWGVPVVSTRFGAEGTTFLPDMDLLVAENEATFLRACLMLARNGSLSRRLATAACGKVKRDYAPATWKNRVVALVAGDSGCSGAILGE
jgi:glycosyltransferase involved in cell wall biosynthesis